MYLIPFLSNFPLNRELGVFYNVGVLKIILNYCPVRSSSAIELPILYLKEVIMKTKNTMKIECRLFLSKIEELQKFGLVVLNIIFFLRLKLI